jgi:hypothetical protein
MSKTSEARGNSTLAVEITNISRHGFWLWLRDKEVFLPFSEFPWFREAPIGKLLNVELPTADHLYWPDLDVDLSVRSIERPDEFPLVSRVV